MNHGRKLTYAPAGAVLMWLVATASASAEIADAPLFLPGAVPPRIMLALSKDHEMFKAAYPDYSDLDGDGQIDNTYSDGFDYFGYFDSDWCYTYSDGRFQPSDKATGPNSHHCEAAWSGNFLNWATMTRMDIVRQVLYGGYRSTDDDGLTVLQRELIPNDAHAFVKVYSGSDLDLYTPFDSSVGGISMCSVTPATSGRSESISAGTASRIRIAPGIWKVWAASEVRQCVWSDEQPNATARAFHPSESDSLGSLAVRVEVCTDKLDHTDICKSYPNGNRKPIGLLQTYGEDGDMHFGLLTGSYARNLSGGVLRRNIGPLTGNTGALDEENEIDPETGRFINQTDGNPGIINTINRLRITHWDFATFKFEDSCNSPGISTISDSVCTNWGNPIGEMIFEALRYYADAGSSAFYTNDDDDYIPGLPSVPSGDWRDPLPASASCANPNLIVMSSGVSSFDRNQYSASGISGLDLPARMSEISTGEGISGSYLLGGGDGMCTAKSISGLADAQGICPEGPSLEGGYYAAGLANHAWTKDMRPEYDDDQNVKTYAVNLAEALPKLQFGDITVLPACQANSNSSAQHDSAGWRTCSLAQFDVEEAEYDGNELVYGRFLAYWEDSTWGNDYDMDGVEELTICRGDRCGGSLASNQVQVTTAAVQAFAGHALRFGFTVTGSVEDGVHLPVLRPGNQNFSVITPTAVNPTNQPAVSEKVLTAGGSAAGLLRDPLWYAAKWGGFDKSLGSTPALVEQWDTKGTGNPDNYYLVRNPARLQSDLEQVFTDIMTGVSSASAVATNSTRLDTETLIYQARFRSDDWSGQLLAYELEGDGSLGTLKWDAGDLIPAPDERKIVTHDGATGIWFDWDELSSAQQAALDTAPDGTTDGLGEERVAWVRGDDTYEQKNAGGTLRNRTHLLGDIVNSDPVFVGAQNFGYEALPTGTPGRTDYQAFRQAKVDTNTDGEVYVVKPMIYVGANDGMLHGFDAATGVEHFAYIPGTLVPELNRPASPTYAHRYLVDGQIAIGDAYISVGGGEAAWRTVLVGTTGAGGRTVFALDVTDPHNFGPEDVLWEFTDEDLGYTFGRPTVARIGDAADGKWVAVFGNGYGSDNHEAMLYVVDLETGTQLAKIETDAGDSANPNGLSSPVLLPDNTRRITAAYAGDLLGNVWKFDLSSATSDGWTVAYSGSPLFVATDSSGTRQPITAPLEIGRHPQHGYMIYFGTGQFFETGDNIVPADPQVQTFYALWDRTASPVGPIAGRSSLQEQEILWEGEPSHSAFKVRVTSNYTVNWTTQRGWYLDLIYPTAGAQGERVIAAPILRGGRVIFPTLIPSVNPCDDGGTSWLMEMDAVSGSRLAQSPLDITEDGRIDSGDLVTVVIDGETIAVPVSGILAREGIIRTPAVVSAGEIEFKLASGTSGNIETVIEQGVFQRARGSWRQLR